MTKTFRPTAYAYVCATAAILSFTVAAPATARPEPKSHRGEMSRGEMSMGFRGADRDVVRGYFAPEIKRGNCPPGLAKKRNGCQPPGQAKKQWTKGRPLPAAVIYEPLPAELVVRLGPPPANHEYVRVAGDILMLAVGTHLVVDAITNLGGALR